MSEQPKNQAKPIDARVWHPSPIFKSNKTAKSQCRVTWCTNWEDCPQYAQKKCVCQYQILGSDIVCPGARITFEEGYTRAARNCSAWMEKKRNEYADALDALEFVPKRMTVVGGGYVYVPIAHMRVYDDKLPFVERGYFIKTTDFTPENILQIIKRKPRALMGGVIPSYAQREIPKFIRQLRDVFPDLYKQARKLEPKAFDAFTESINNLVGKTAYALTCVDGSQFRDIHGNTFTLNRTERAFTCDKYSTFAPFSNADGGSRIVKLTDKTTVKIESNDQWDEKTIFID